MIQILFLILKCIGIILLALIGLVLLAVLAALFVPVRYQAEGSRYGELNARGRVSWFFRGLSLEFFLEKGEVSSSVKLFGRRLGGGPAEAEDLEGDLQEISEPSVHTTSLDREETGGGTDRRKETEERKRPSAEKASGGKEERKAGDGPSSGRMQTAVQGLFRKIAHIRSRIRALFEKKDQVMAFLRDEENKKTFRLVRSQLWRVLRHVLPRSIKGRVTFGFDDPYRTGQVLSWAAILYPVYRDSLQITPVFDREVLEGELSIKGRIRLAVLLGAAARLMMDKNFRKLVRKLMDR